MLEYASKLSFNQNKWNINTLRNAKTYDPNHIPSNLDLLPFGSLRTGAQSNWLPKPFLPGDFGPDRKMYGAWGPLGYIKGAGVDSVGMVLGSAAMAGLALRNFKNFTTTVNLNVYAKMSDSTNSSVGLDETGKPKFWSTGADDWINLRWTKTDFERNTILVPDIHLIQPGDLLVNYNSNRYSEQEYDPDDINDMHIGIVVSIPTSFKKQTDAANAPEPVGALSASDVWSKINVVSVRPGLRTVTLGSWGNGANMFGGFTDSPESYQIRRLLKWNSQTANGNIRQPYELIDAQPAGLDVKIVYKTNMGSYGRFIPNTGEPLQFEKVTVIQRDINGNEIKINGDHLNLVPLPPKDAYFFPGENTVVKGNIKNKTT